MNESKSMTKVLSCDMIVDEANALRVERNGKMFNLFSGHCRQTFSVHSRRNATRRTVQRLLRLVPTRTRAPLQAGKPFASYLLGEAGKSRTKETTKVATFGVHSLPT